MSLSGLLTNLALPPLLFVLVALAGLLLAWRGVRTGLVVAALALGGQWLVSTPLAAHLLVVSLQRELHDASPLSSQPGAIIVLGGDVAHASGGTEPGPLTLERLRAGAALQRRTGLPILVTGGVIGKGTEALGALMARSLEQDFGASVRWIEPRSGDTWQNALFSAAMLHDAGIDSALLVTHSWHMPRALAVFERRGLHVAPAPVRLEREIDWSELGLTPRPDYAAQSWYAIREWVGRAVYRIRG